MKILFKEERHAPIFIDYYNTLYSCGATIYNEGSGHDPWFPGVIYKPHMVVGELDNVL